MLSNIRIKDFAIIDDLEIEFRENFSVITGETGAGKSILIGAITMLLGSRGDTDLIRSKSDELVVEGLFQNGDNQLIIKRTLNRQGRSKILLNGDMTALSTIRERTASLVDISGQHQHQILLNEDSHIDILNRYTELGEELIEYNKLKKEYTELKNRLDELTRMALEKENRLDLLRYQRDELAGLAISREEHDQLVTESNILRNASRFEEVLKEVESLLYSRDDSAVELIGRSEKRLSELIEMSSEYKRIVEELSQIKAVVSDIASLIISRLSSIDLSYERLNEVEGRLHRIRQICKKYRMNIEEIKERLSKIEEEIDLLLNSDIQIENTERELKDIFDKIVRSATDIHNKRENAASELTKRCEEILKRLGFKDAKITFDIKFEKPSDFKDSSRILEDGFDRVRILFAPNTGEEFKPLMKIASGGELSRVMLAFKSALLGRDTVSTYIFDEVDTGIGGAVAESVGLFLRELSRKRQVICITHLPQIASLAKEHFAVIKTVERGRTRISIKRLNYKERLNEIARMLGGEKISEKNRAYAEELLEKNN